MSEQTPVHWTDDEELLGQFVLDRLKMPRRNELQTHLASCERCQRVVQEELRLAAAAKRLGRSEMKQRLNLRVDAGRRRLVWIEAMGAAAVLFVAVGIAWYGGFFTSQQDFVPAVADKSIALEEHRKGEQESRAYQEAGKGEASRESKPILRDKKESTDAARSETERSIADRTVVGAEERKAAERIERDETANLAAAAPATQATSPNAIWIEGVELEGADTDRRAEALHMNGRSEGKMKKDAAARSIPAEVAGQGEQRSINVQQRQLSELPSLQQQLQRQRRSVQALIERLDGQLRMTVFTDEAAGESVRPPAVQQIRDDSVVVTVGQQRIGFRLPEAWAR